MINDNSKLIVYLNSVVNSVFKILPLFEEKNIGVDTYIESLLFELYGLNEAVNVEHSYEYISLLSTLESVRTEIGKEISRKATVKREIFKCINIIKNMVGKLEEVGE
ncbi:hypothetical protein PQE74_gp196 [Bacillus phage vB_BanS_Chewbecca]|uniref:Uncharacterized protein n=4 Tax=Caudoviricetes TaxID=2731619 RepID=A0AAE8YVR8_9CAUD|nr:hypothetical protein PQE72_gp223 [Bacillus phage vB_BanS_Skywalker]YP_010681102.1 hypothetical protein PQE73_gp206 [Bacillus phage vB_BanS_MrDarsey]YP_010681339.1 hypothetical protein PQE74_gp196 [Bacillus phage vB_BanS_Chewbecca]UGO46279.1 hypothetical protein CHEWBECCA_196 [Bacillus phage vB_BanS_Chewbecca]UGO48038.1 hypothetical protein MRDARSEY_206 [Bacillus phage vB_BanS_MrDarsey]UGO51220.1 hypothetical protein SKYWALKER_63 [Bacillus phage vB_BanS_Skywalker]